MGESHLPPMKGTKGFGFPTSRHWGRARQITSGLKIGKSCFKGNPTLRGGDTTWGRQPDQRPSPQAGSCKKFSHWNESLLSLNLRELESVPGMVAMSAGQRMLLSTPSKATSPSVAHFTATSGLMRTNLKLYTYSTLNQESGQDICREFAPVQPLVECCEIELGSWVSQTRQEIEGFDQVRG